MVQQMFPQLCSEEEAQFAEQHVEMQWGERINKSDHNLEQSKTLLLHSRAEKGMKAVDSPVRGKFPGKKSKAQPALPVGYI